MVINLSSLAQLSCGEGGGLQAHITGVCVGGCLQCLGHTGFACPHGMSAFLVYTAQAPGCYEGELSTAAPGLQALPRSKQLMFRFSDTPQSTDSVGPASCSLLISEQLRRPCAW